MPKDKVPRNPDHVNLQEANEVAYWCEKFDCTEADLRYCVKYNGESPDDVRTCINKKNGRE